MTASHAVADFRLIASRAAAASIAALAFAGTAASAAHGAVRAQCAVAEPSPAVSTTGLHCLDMGPECLIQPVHGIIGLGLYRRPIGFR